MTGTSTAHSSVASRSTEWSVLMAVGITSIAVSLVMFAWPDVTLRVVAVLVGLWVLLVVAGVVCLRDLVKALALIAVIIALAFLFGGLAWFVLAAQTSGAPRVWLMVVGLLSIVAGVVILALPELSLTTLVYLTAAAALALGAGELVTALQLRKLAAGQPAAA